MIEKDRGPYFGADVVSIGGGATAMALDGFDNKIDYHLSEVNSTGAIVMGTQNRRSVTLVDLQQDGVEVCIGRYNNPQVRPGEKLNLSFGEHKVVVTGTDKPGIMLNGASPNMLTYELDRVRSGRDKI